MNHHLEEAKLLRQEPGGRHYNCAQSLLVPFVAEIGMEKEEADALGAFFGAGMMHGSACGTLTAALMILGKAGKDKETAKKLVDDFLAAHGTTDCRCLLAAAEEKGIARKENCDGLVFDMCQKLAALLTETK
ncbi:C-GCAxxG-C-C family protein [Selenomonas sputigena]|uniref:C_GCAxxG_C_C family protein n=2 Tax=Selenomonas sputigena (strain ATCC 35185 / DSM 20758 / CCUG 44933 / VPI D19B-28) TaxID=546271 RepID=F4F037_SELS3|nr:C-GCAxxG-C-C family protein [Selenomonas sputigena]AEC00176.1 C_GCAxxG_C_C family protein [Selenomonas sputigena ATCC 35185]